MTHSQTSVSKFGHAIATARVLLPHIGGALSSGLREILNVLLTELKMLLLVLGGLWAFYGWLIGRTIEHGITEGEPLRMICLSAGGLVGICIALTAIAIRTYFLNNK